MKSSPPLIECNVGYFPGFSRGWVQCEHWGIPAPPHRSGTGPGNRVETIKLFKLPQITFTTLAVLFLVTFLTFQVFFFFASMHQTRFASQPWVQSVRGHINTQI